MFHKILQYLQKWRFLIAISAQVLAALSQLTPDHISNVFKKGGNLKHSKKSEALENFVNECIKENKTKSTLRVQIIFCIIFLITTICFVGTVFVLLFFIHTLSREQKIILTSVSKFISAIINKLINYFLKAFIALST